ncbi:MAG: DNA-binding protein [Anaerolineaceae bacterium]
MKTLPQNNLPEGLAGPALRALQAAEITSLEKLTRFTEKEIKQKHGIGPNALAKLKSALLAKGLTFREQAVSGEDAARKGMV